MVQIWRGMTEHHFVPRLKSFTVRGEELRPGDTVFLYPHTAGYVVDTLWCAKAPGCDWWDHNVINFRAGVFPWGQYRVHPRLEYRIFRDGVYADGWSPEEVEAAKAAWEREQAGGAEDYG